MTTAQAVSTIPGAQTFKYVLRQNPPAPVSFTAASVTQTFTILGLPIQHVVTGVRVNLVVPFAAVGMSACTVTIGAYDSVTTTTVANWYAPAFGLTQPISETSFMYWSPFTSYTMNQQDVQAIFTATGAQLATLTAGEVEITIHYRPL